VIITVFRGLICRLGSLLEDARKVNPYSFSALRPVKHLYKCLGLLRSRPDPFRICKIETDKASTSEQGLFDFPFTPFLAVCHEAHLQAAEGYPADLVYCRLGSVLFI